MLDEDFDGPSMVAANFTNGSALISCVQVGIIDDNVFEGPHSFRANIEGSTVGMLDIGMANIANVTILDPEGIAHSSIGHLHTLHKMHASSFSCTCNNSIFL